VRPRLVVAQAEEKVRVTNITAYRETTKHLDI
jgi:hypothetical protein